MPDIPNFDDWVATRKPNVDSALNLISKYESGGRNIKQQIVPPGGGYNPSVGRVTGPSTAGGPWQITNSTWQKRAPREIVQKYPTAMHAPVEVQRAVAGKIFSETGFQDWAPYNAALRKAIARGETGQQPSTQIPDFDTWAQGQQEPTPSAQPQPRVRVSKPASPWGTGAIGRGVKTTRIAPRGISAARVEGEARPSEATSMRGALRNIAGQAGLPTQIPSEAGDFINQMVAEGTAGLMQRGAGLALQAPGLPMGAGAPVAERLRQGAQQIQQGSQAIDKDTQRASVNVPVIGNVSTKDVQSLGSSAIASGPALILQRLGVPGPVAFGLDQYLASTGRGEEFKKVIQETGLGTATGALYELPIPQKWNLLSRIGAKLGLGGAGGYGLAKAFGMSEEEARKNGAITALFMLPGARREPSALSRGLDREIAREQVREPTTTPRPEIAPVAEPLPEAPQAAAPEVAAVTHPKLQRRLDDGTYGKETKAETEARRAQVESASATPEPAPEELIRPPEAAVSPAELPPEAAQRTTATTAPIPEVGRGLMESAYPESRGPIKDFKGEQITRGDERGAVLLPSRQQLVELGRAAIDVPSRISHQRIAGPIERMVEQHRAVRGVEFESERLKKETARQLTGLSPEEQIAIIDAMENDYKGPTWDALSLRQRQIATQLKPVHDMMAEYNKKFDVFTEREMPEGVRHIFHWWNDPKTGRPYETQWGEFSKTGPSSRQRTIETYAEGRAKGLEQASTNPGEILGKSFEQMVRVKEARDLIDNLKVWKTGELNGVVGEIPKGLEDRYERVEIPALKPTKFVPQGEGGPGLLVKQPVYALKELVPKLRAYFEKPEWTKFDEVMSAAKSLKLSLSFFHGLGLTFKNMTMFRFRSIHDIRNGLKFMEGMDDTMKRLYSNGLETALTKDYSDLIDATGHFHRKTLLGRVSDITHKNPMSRLIFSYVRVGLKNAYAHDTYGKMEPRYIRRMEKQLGRPLTDAETVKAQNQAARAVVERASNLFSGEDKRLGALEASDLVTRLYFNPKAQRIWQKALISPTWQREHIIEAKNLAKSIVAPGMMGPIAREHIKQAFGATTLLAVADLTNYFITRWQDEDHKGKHLWENPTGSKFSVRLPWDEPEYSVTDKNGKERKVAGGPAFVRPFKAITEVPEVAAALFAKEGERDIVDKLSAKVHPWLQAAAEQMQFSGEKRKQGMLERGKALATSVAPIAADQPLRILKGQRTPLDLIPWVIGAPTQKPVQAKPSEEVSRPTRSRRPTRRSR